MLVLVTLPLKAATVMHCSTSTLTHGLLLRPESEPPLALERFVVVAVVCGHEAATKKPMAFEAQGMSLKSCSRMSEDAPSTGALSFSFGLLVSQSSDQWALARLQRQQADSHPALCDTTVVAETCRAAAINLTYISRR